MLTRPFMVALFTGEVMFMVGAMLSPLDEELELEEELTLLEEEELEELVALELLGALDELLLVEELEEFPKVIWTVAPVSP